jgi:hypothetical protein
MSHFGLGHLWNLFDGINEGSNEKEKIYKFINIVSEREKDRERHSGSYVRQR